MAIEHAVTLALNKPWGVVDPGDWSHRAPDGGLIGEVLFERPGNPASSPKLLLKVLLSSAPLSIQVHPGDAYAQSIGLANGKSEAWYVLSAVPGARVALGLSEKTTAHQLRTSLDDGSFPGTVAWWPVSANDIIAVPAGTIHAIGAGIVLAEIQQRSDTTFRLFDFGSARELHIDRAVRVANPGPAGPRAPARRLSPQREILVQDPHFVFERLDLSPDSSWRLAAERETWLLVLSGQAHAADIDVKRGDAIFAQDDSISLRPGADGLVCLVAYAGCGGPITNLLARVDRPDTDAVLSALARATLNQAIDGARLPS